MLARARDLLLEWFTSNGRDLPWRHTRDPYRILVSEVMLQQTQVDRVVPRYHAFLQQFPTIEALAAAPTADVIRAWAGLGYNRRAVNLQRTARAVLDLHGGSFPSDVDALRTLPGIGPYTAGAVACFAFERDVAFLDTNIRRVVLRLLADPQQPAPSERELVALAGQAVPAGAGWRWNQAIMELGALICTAAAPACWRCPVQPVCRDYAARRIADEALLPPEQLARPRRLAEKREAPYAGSNRYYRGRLLALLRDLAPGQSLALETAGPQLKADYTTDDLPWLERLAAGMARDGLIVLNASSAQLPE